MASGLEVPLSDLLAAADWLPPKELPNFRPYLRSKYRQLPEEAVEEMEAFFSKLAKKHGVHGPDQGEDEA